MNRRTVRRSLVTLVVMSTAACASLGARAPEADAFRLERLYLGRSIGDTSNENMDVALGQVIAEYKRRFHQESVLWTSATVRARFR